MRLVNKISMKILNGTRIILETFVRWTTHTLPRSPVDLHYKCKSWDCYYLEGTFLTSRDLRNSQLFPRTGFRYSTIIAGNKTPPHQQTLRAFLIVWLHVSFHYCSFTSCSLRQHCFILRILLCQYYRLYCSEIIYGNVLYVLQLKSKLQVRRACLYLRC